MNEERDWNVVMEDFGGGSNRVSYYAQRSERNLASEKILAEGLTEQEAFSLLCSFGEAKWANDFMGGFFHTYKCGG